jgi:tetratricopeptide (TPR) repeat protein
MKNIINITGISLLLLSGMAMTSCSDFLDPSPESIYTTETFYQSQNDFELAISAVYAAQQDAYNGQAGMLHLLEARSDNTNSVNTNLYDDGAASFTDNSACGPAKNVWTYMYQMITRCNGILIRIDNVTFDDAATKNYIKGEAYALRGWAYETLGKFFGGVPLIVDAEYSEAETRAIARSTQDETFAQAVKDYQASISLLPESWTADKIGRVTKYAADAALGRLYMFMNQPANAKQYLEAVINSGKYTMAPNYLDCFTDAYDNNTSRDRLWEVQYIGGLTGEGQDWSEMCMPEDCGITEGYAVRGSSAAMQVSTDLLNEYESGDLRKSEGTSDKISGSLALGYTWCTKFSRHKYVPQSGTDWANNLPIIRYTDVIMLEAEAINATDGPTATAVSYINAVRNRAGLANLTSAQTATKDTFLKAIKHERRVEFMYEGVRWFDLVRWGDFIDTFKKFFAESDEGNGRYVTYIQSFRSIFAIPQTEIDRYDNSKVMWQNPNY